MNLFLFELKTNVLSFIDGVIWYSLHNVIAFTTNESELYLDTFTNDVITWNKCGFIVGDAIESKAIDSSFN